MVSGDAETAQSVADHTPGSVRGLTYEEFHDGIASEMYDAIYVATPNSRHLPYAETAAAMGKHVLCEKPMEASVERARRLVATTDTVRLMIGYRVQTDPIIRRCREAVQNGVIGDPVHVHGLMTQPLLELIPDPDQWRLDPTLAGPGTSVTDLGIYPINTTRFVLGEDPIAVSATMRSTSTEFSRVPDEWATFEVTFESGVLAACSASQHAHESGRFEILGTEGRLSVEPAFFGDEDRSLLIDLDDTAVEISAEPIDQMTEEFDYFADRIITGTDITPDGGHGVVDIEVIDVIYESARTNEQIRL